MSASMYVMTIYGLVSILGVWTVLVRAAVMRCDDQQRLAPSINGSRSDIRLSVGEGETTVLQCSAPYAVKWIKLYQKDSIPIVYQYSEIANDTTATSFEQPNFFATLRATASLIEQLPFVLFTCIAVEDAGVLGNSKDPISPSTLDDLRLTKANLRIRATASTNEFLNDAINGLNGCVHLVTRKALTAEALLQTLNGDLLASRSATLTLEKWCGDHRLAPVPKVVAKQMNIGQTPPPLPQVAQTILNLNTSETVRYRSVELTCGEKVLSVADNWYVPERLTPAMNKQLDTTNTPFGKVVAPFQPFRQTSAVNFLWQPLPDGWEMSCAVPGTDLKLTIPDRVLEHQATVSKNDGLPISFVDERYTKSMFDFL